MIDASAGFMKDGPKNRLRAQDIHRIVDVFNKQDAATPLRAHGRRWTRSRRTTSTSTCRATSTASSPKTGRTSKATSRAASRRRRGRPGSATGPSAPYSGRAVQTQPPGYVDLAVDKPAIKATIYEHPEFKAFIAGMNAHFAGWREQSAAKC
jgi:type I restriction enzyme M protein